MIFQGGIYATIYRIKTDALIGFEINRVDLFI